MIIEEASFLVRINLHDWEMLKSALVLAADLEPTECSYTLEHRSQLSGWAIQLLDEMRG